MQKIKDSMDDSGDKISGTNIRSVMGVKGTHLDGRFSTLKTSTPKSNGSPYWQTKAMNCGQRRPFDSHYPVQVRDWPTGVQDHFIWYDISHAPEEDAEGLLEHLNGAFMGWQIETESTIGISTFLGVERRRSLRSGVGRIVVSDFTSGGLLRVSGRDYQSSTKVT
jgi:hypothetical protein